MSTMGLLGWWTTVTALTIAAFGSWRDERERAVVFAVFSAVFAYLALDDLFQLHENVYLQLGFDQRLVQLLYAMGVLLVAAWGMRVLRETTPFTVLLVAGGCFVVSIVADARNFEGRLHAIEDGTKLLGIFTLAAWALACAIQRPSTDGGGRSEVRDEIGEEGGAHDQRGPASPPP
jgi:hypothetical protein